MNVPAPFVVRPIMRWRPFIALFVLIDDQEIGVTTTTIGVGW